MKIFSTVFLGNPRTSLESVHESSLTSLWPLVLLALICLGLGLVPRAIFSGLDLAVKVFWPPAELGMGLAGSSLLAWTLPVGVGLLGAVAVLIGVIALVKKRTGPTWDCGFARPTPRMQYSGGSLTRPLSSLVGFGRISSPDPLLDRVLRPIAHRFERVALRFHSIQRGHTQLYLAQILGFLLILLLILSF